MRIYTLIILWILSTPFYSQPLSVYREQDKCGIRCGDKTLIPAQYDSILGFDRYNTVCLVASKSLMNTVTNPLTGEEEPDYDFFYINTANRKIGILPEGFPDTVYTFKNQQELYDNYMEHTPVFKILFGNKIYMVSREGKQLSAGFDNIYESPLRYFYITEYYFEKNGKPYRLRGLVDSTGHVIAKTKYCSLKINPDDSAVYCCSSATSNNLNDDVFDLKGKLIFTNKRHIEFASKTSCVFKDFEPEQYSFEDHHGKQFKTMPGKLFYYLKHQKALVIDEDVWYMVDMVTYKKTRIDPEQYVKNLLTLYYEPN